MVAKSTFRNEQVAAPLKGGSNPLLPIPRSTFRNEQVAAPLKAQHGAFVILPCLPAFRNEQVAAPLKGRFACNTGGHARCFPQRTSCGPIEGWRNNMRGQAAEQALSATNKLRPH